MPISFNEACRQILAATRPLGRERVELLAAAGRVLTDDFIAPGDLPRYDNSAMDGFAVRAADATAGHELTISGYQPAGSAELPAVAPGCAVKIMTGAAIPAGGELVVPLEETEERDGRVRLRTTLSVGEHIRFRGEDLAAGTRVLTAGTLLRAPQINLLASFGQAMVTVGRRPTVAILSTGDELVELGSPLAPGQIVNCNAYSLAAAVREAGGEPRLLGIARDTRESLRDKLQPGFQSDVLMTSGGVSAGDRDLVREVLAELGVEQKFWKVDIKPGRPTAFGVKGATLVFALPGNPVSTMVTFAMFVQPSLRQLQGVVPAIPPFATALLAEPFAKRLERTQFLRVQLRWQEGRLIATSAGDQNTGIVRTMLRADGIAILPAGRERFESGDAVEVRLLD